MNRLKEFKELSLERDILLAEREKIHKELQRNYFKLLENRQKLEKLADIVNITHP